MGISPALVVRLVEVVKVVEVVRMVEVIYRYEDE